MSTSTVWRYGARRRRRCQPRPIHLSPHYCTSLDSQGGHRRTWERGQSESGGWYNCTSVIWCCDLVGAACGAGRRGAAEARRPIRSRVRSGWTPRTCSPSRTRKTWLDPSDLEPFCCLIVPGWTPWTSNPRSALLSGWTPRTSNRGAHRSPSTLTKGKLNTVFRASVGGA